jgi:hypothetical protein
MPMPTDLEQQMLRETASAEQFSFNIEQFKAHMMEGDGVIVVLRAQLYLEHVLIATLTDALAKPDAINLKGLNFPAKLNLCMAMSLLGEALRNAMTKINGMRNGAAHKLHVEFRADDRKVFWAALPQFLRDNLLLDLSRAKARLTV